MRRRPATPEHPVLYFETFSVREPFPPRIKPEGMLRSKTLSCTPQPIFFRPFLNRGPLPR
jgi:hypothetical protein